jgi:hypothetical protein
MQVPAVTSHRVIDLNVNAAVVDQHGGFARTTSSTSLMM